VLGKRLTFPASKIDGLTFTYPVPQFEEHKLHSRCSKKSPFPDIKQTCGSLATVRQFKEQDVADGTNQLALEVEGASVARPFLLQ
jgi:hypothetical protein